MDKFEGQSILNFIKELPNCFDPYKRRVIF